MNELLKLTGITGEIDSLFHEAAYRLGQSDSAMTTLCMLYSHDGKCDISEICRHSGLRKQTLNSTLRKMEDNGLIRLERKDSRNKTVILTDKGNAEAERSAGRLLRSETDITKEFSADELELYLMLSQRFLDRFRTLVNQLPERET